VSAPTRFIKSLYAFRYDDDQRCTDEDSSA
jgi:hypothetical protein